MNNIDYYALKAIDNLAQLIKQTCNGANNTDYYAIKAIDNLVHLINQSQDLNIMDINDVPYREATIDYYADAISKLTKVALRARREREEENNEDMADSDFKY